MASQFPKIASALEALPDDTILDGEIVALNDQGRPSFNLLQNHRSAANTIVMYAFDVLAYAGKSVVGLPLSKRRDLLERALARVTEPIRLSQSLAAPADALIKEWLPKTCTVRINPVNGRGRGPSIKSTKVRHW